MKNEVQERVIYLMAGGSARRMGRDKRTMRVDGDKTLIERVVERLEQTGLPVYLLGKEPATLPLGLPIIPDSEPGAGPLAALAHAMQTAPANFCFAVASDMPNLDPHFIRAMFDAATPDAILAPKTGESLHLLHAIYPADCLPAARAVLDRGGRSLFELAQHFQIVTIPNDISVPFDPEALVNLNTPEDVETWIKREENS